MQPCRYLILVINMFLDKGDLVRIHNFGNFGDLVHAHNLPILQAGVVAAFGQLFSEAVCAGQSASCPWPLLSAWHRVCHQQVHLDRKGMHHNKTISRLSSYPAPDPLAVNPQSIKFFGQWPWRLGKQEPPYLAKEKEGIEALTYNERTRTKHIRIILDLLGLAVIKLDVKNIHPWV